MDNKDQEYYIWQHKKTSCKACRELSKRIYTIDEIPNRPHPNCRCSIFSVSDILLKNLDYLALYLTQSETDPEAFESMLDNLQFFLDMVGLIEGVGTIADVANVIIYLARKDYVNAGLSGFKILPLASIFLVGGKITARVVKVTSKADDVLDVAKGINKAVDVVEGAGKAGKTIGKPFDPKGKVVQEGVDPNTLKPGKKLDTLDSNRQKNAVKYAGDKPIIVDRNGNVLDGHHRLNDAIQNDRAVDVQIGY